MEHIQTSQTNSVLGKLFRASYKTLTNPEQLLVEARNRLKNQITEQDCKVLEDKLNMFFSLQNKTIEAEKFQAGFNDYFNKLVKNKIKDFEPGLKRSGSQQKEHTSWIALRTIKNRCDYILKLLDALVQVDSAKIYEIFNQTEQEMRNIVSSLEQIVNIGEKQQTLLGMLDQRLYLTQHTSSFNELISQMDNIYSIATTINSDLEKEYGEAFEASLDILNAYINRSVTENIDDFMKDFALHRENKGKESADRGMLTSELFEITKNRKASLRSQGSVSATEKTSYGSIHTMVKSSPFDKRSGKVDVEFKLPELKDKLFRISAKNWSGLAGHDFGETSLWSALLRTVNFDKTLQYGLVAGYFDSEGKLWEEIKLHQFAKLASVLDILMGFSQKNNFANTIVIYDRSSTQRPIKVFSINSLLEKICEQLDYFSLSGYDDTKVSANLSFTKEFLQQTYISHIQSVLSGIKIKLDSKILQM